MAIPAEKSPAICWFRDDLRLADNPALAAAAESGWLPQLARIPAKHIHAPSELSPLELAGFGVTLGENYPEPIVKHAQAWQRALAAASRMRNT